VIMSNALSWVLALLSGIGLGLVFFGGLWWTVRRGMRSSAPALWFSGSWLVRSAAVLAGFYGASRGDWRHLAACLLGFVVARWVLLRLPGTLAARRLPPLVEASP